MRRAASLAKPNSTQTGELTTPHNEKVRRFSVKETIRLKVEYLGEGAGRVAGSR